jgi:transposase
VKSIEHQGPKGKVVVGVDTHKDVHVAVALDRVGGRLGVISLPADRAGYAALEQWALGFGSVLAFGIEGTSSYGAGLTGFLRRAGHRVVEVNRPDRSERHRHGKSDPLDAENAARAVLAGRETGTPKSADGQVEMLRQIKVAKDGAVKARAQALTTLRALLVTAPADLRTELEPLSKRALVARCAGLRPGPVTSPLAATRHALRSLARRWQELTTEIDTHEDLLISLTAEAAPELVAAYGIGPDTAADPLIAIGDNRDRVPTEAALAKLCGVNPIPASSGKTQRLRLNRGGNRQANAALYRIVVVRMRCHVPTLAYVARRTAEGKSKPEIMRCLKRYVAREVWSHTRPAAHVVEPLEFAS